MMKQKRNKRVLISIMLVSMMLITLVSGCGSKSSNEDKSTKNAVEEKLSEMTLEEKVSQMIIPAIRRWSEDGVDEQALIDGVINEAECGDPVTELTPELKSILTEFSFGGVILFAENFVDTEQTVRFIQDIQDANDTHNSGIKLFICSDNEGGRVMRLNTGTAFCGSMGIGATNDTSYAYDVADMLGEELDAVGINVNFAPDADVNYNPSNPVIGERSFSDDPDTVAEYDIEFIKGMHNNNVMTAAKHFPGHGNTQVDSHTGLPLVDMTADELEKNEFIPFQRCIDEGTDFVMTAHIQYPKIETETYTSIADGQEIYLPATLSKDIITGILREKMGYDGLVVTDALVMDSIYKNFDPLDTAKYAINAGEDILLMPLFLNRPEKIDDMRDYISGIVKMVEDGEIPEERIDESVRRILTAKEKYGLLTTSDSDNASDTDSDESIEEKIENAEKIVGSVEHHEKEWDITEKSITLLKNDDSVIPLDSSEKTLILCPIDNQVMSAEYAVKRLKDEDVIPEDSDITVKCYDGCTPEDTPSLVEGVDNVIGVSVTYKAENLDPNNEEGANSAFLDSVIESTHKNNGKFIFVSTRLPYDAARYTDADAILVAYGERGMSQMPELDEKAGVAGNTQVYGPNIPVAIFSIFGGNTPTGKLPINIPKMNDDYTYTDEILYKRGFGLGE